jgi:hypothetical protein
MVSVVKLVTMLEEYTTKKQNSDVCFLWAKGLNAKHISKERLPVNGGMCLSHKVVHNWVDKFSHRRLKVRDDAQTGVEVAETTAKRLLCCRLTQW